ncbi:hypothetical protein SAMN04488072_11315 [Lentibacillus halodurans]|uniref:Uncharacterized protein n=1 Tax=Lentibacillus halodurans TaxID=237679 RepID=A0A1I0ZRV5_9BACI|nr:hypothetical protein [Lentibacillus halodurans]SFB28267.1 hypothetical protein SAMN04488072_11315 [Lentibacillus halodurans]
MQFNGEIISGEFDERTNEFTLQQVKHLSTESVLNENQLNTLSDYLHKNSDQADGQVLTLYDQILVRLSPEEVEQFLNDLESINFRYH